MPRLIIIFLTFLFIQDSFGQTDEKFKEGKDFKSVFQNKKSGEFRGTTNGVLYIKNEFDKEIILDFQGSYGALQIEQDIDEVYDVSTKSYYGKTTSRKTEIKYETYAWANGIGIKWEGQWFELSTIDGACDMVIEGVDYSYKAESSTEYLVISIQKELKLSNWQYLIRAEHTMNPDNIEGLKKKKKVISLQPNSTLIFTINRTQTHPDIQPIQKVFDDYVKYQESTELTYYFGQTYPDSIPVIFAPDIISNKGRLEHGISFTPDKQELAFGILNKNGFDFSGEIYYSKNVNNNWTEPILFEPLKNKSVYLPYFTPNGKSLLYAQSIPDKNRLYITDIWRLEKIDGNWGFPKKIQTPLSSISREANASMTYDGTIYFSSNRNCEGKENCYTADLFNSKLVDNEYQSVEELSGLNSSNDEESIFISPKEEYIIFCRHTDNETFKDLYISYRGYNNNWTEPQLLDSTINSKDSERRPFVSIDNKFLFFTRLQIREQKLTESDIYWVNTSKVFKPFVYNPLPDITLQVGKKFELLIPVDYFKDIDDIQLTLSTNQNEVDWFEFDNEKMKLSGLPTQDGDFELVFTAVDKFSNKTEDKIKITVGK